MVQQRVATWRKFKNVLQQPELWACTDIQKVCLKVSLLADPSPPLLV